MTKPMKPQRIWAVVSCHGRVWATHPDRWIAMEDADTRNGQPLYNALGLTPFTVRRVLVTEIRRKK